VDFYQTTWRYVPEDTTLYIPEEITYKNLFCIFSAGKSRRPAHDLPSGGQEEIKAQGMVCQAIEG
jgi:hypothetical protein